MYPEKQRLLERVLEILHKRENRFLCQIMFWHGGQSVAAYEISGEILDALKGRPTLESTLNLLARHVPKKIGVDARIAWVKAMLAEQPNAIDAGKAVIQKWRQECPGHADQEA